MKNTNISNINITKQKFIRIADQRVFIGIVPDPEIGYFKSLVKLQEAGHNINEYAEIQTIKLNIPRLFKPVMKTLEDFIAGEKVNIWSHQGYYPYEQRSIRSIDFEKREVVLEPDEWSGFEPDVFDEFHFLAGLEDNKDVDGADLAKSIGMGYFSY